MHMHRVWFRAESFVPSLSSIRTQMTLYVNRTLVRISISSLFSPSAFPLSLLTLLSPICCYVYPPDFFLCLLFFLCVLFSFTLKAIPVPLPSLLLFPVPSILNFVQDAAIHSIIPTAETFKACRKEPKFQLLLLKTPFSTINRTNEARFPVVLSLTHSLR